MIDKSKTKFLVFLVFALIAFSSKGQELTRKEYIKKYAPLAVKQMQLHQIPASITIAQGILESGDGNSRLAVKANNHFGIKCHGWEGKKIYADDDKKNECFRNYNNALASFRDHSLFLKKYDRYSFLFDFKINDYKSWAKGLKKAGYATNEKYPEKLIKIIEENFLYKYDSQYDKDHFIDQKRSTYMHFNKIKYVLAEKRETYGQIAQELNLKLVRLQKYNDSENTKYLEEGSIVFIQPKKSRCKARLHISKDNETLYKISQKYGVKLKKLLLRNPNLTNEKLKKGIKVILR